VAGRQHGVVARRQLITLGLGERAIGRGVSGGYLLPMHRGVYAVGHRKLTIEGRWMAAVLACGPGAVLSHRSAGQLWRLVLPTPIEIEVTRPRKFRGLTGIRGHQSVLPADEVGTQLGIPVTSAPRTQFDLASVLDRHQVGNSFNEMEVRRLTDPLSVVDLIERYPGHRGVATLRAVLADGAAPTVTRRGLEERFAALLEADGLPRPRFNATLPLRGRLLEVDCMWPAQRLIVELDGRDVHGTKRAFESDRQRDRSLLAEGWRSTRVTWRQLEGEAVEVVADLRRLLV
jgi:very-short-patch-repair endonuclease